ncbi:MAG: DUF2024 family protein [Bacteroidetes bacterium]|nr:DUF2024 family protein [Bacteroidota bacterium]
MKVAVWDTYVTRKNGDVMHFDIIVPAHIKDEQVIYSFGKEYLDSKNETGQALSSKECSFCHVETVKPEWENTIIYKGYFIFEMENCKE